MELSFIERVMRRLIQRYDHEKYWRYRAVVIDPSKGNRLTDTIRLLYIKRADAFNNASMGTHRNAGAQFASPPELPHGLNGIIISHNAVIGKDCILYHQVTIGQGRGGAPVIGDGVLIGAGAKIIGGITIGSGAKIAAGCVVMQDIPANAVVLPGPVDIHIKKGEN